MAAGRPQAAISVLPSPTCAPSTATYASAASSFSPAGRKYRTVRRRCQSTVATGSPAYGGSRDLASTSADSAGFPLPSSSSSLLLSSGAANTAPGLGPSTDPRFPEIFPEAALSPAYPSPAPERARGSAKLAALHARLGLSQRLPLETLARALVDTSADPSLRFNNASLAYLGATLIHYHVSEWLMCRYPRLPMVILYAAMKAYAGPQALADVAHQWGVEAAAAPGAEVDPGLLQFSLVADRQVIRRWGYQRAEAKNLKKYKWRHGISSRVVLDDDFGDMLSAEDEAEAGVEAGLAGEAADGNPASALDLGGSMDAGTKTRIADDAHANFVRAVAGAVYAHGGREPVRAFVRAHVLSRQLDLERLFRFKLPTRELAYLCARENFEPPVARLEAETGRQSRTPVFVVGIYSGNDKLGEGAAASLDHARAKAAMNSLKAWYLYSPGEDVRVPSDMLVEGAAPWEPAYVDIGEIL
ncbi:60S ribosomal protein l3 [Grosmannia clavigera kw1407]|uniref:Large ribosomal subunit protein mL44 n=1 Tax=Grosmannia clavigera (strain kw1407 / UAMH 11150) TaxID=655863 RepID=F0XI02_GROCL|nr:60S ribosomal protein l3 [Grosmannia clavigera kw1407]EFX03328.1 60S ribosomal protein l3 [Grosmannia clavigera kw1407]